jgi:hypothetical protein
LCTYALDCGSVRERLSARMKTPEIGPDKRKAGQEGHEWAGNGAFQVHAIVPPETWASCSVAHADHAFSGQVSTDFEHRQTSYREIR